MQSAEQSLSSCGNAKSTGSLMWGETGRTPLQGSNQGRGGAFPSKWSVIEDDGWKAIEDPAACTELVHMCMCTSEHVQWLPTSILHSAPAAHGLEHHHVVPPAPNACLETIQAVPAT